MKAFALMALMALFACSPLVMAAGAQDQPASQQENAVEEYAHGMQPDVASRYIFNRHFQCLRRSRTHDLRRFERPETYRRISGLGQRLHWRLNSARPPEGSRHEGSSPIRRDHCVLGGNNPALGEHPGRLPPRLISCRPSQGPTPPPFLFPACNKPASMPLSPRLPPAMLAQLVRRRGMRNAEALAQLAVARCLRNGALQHRLLKRPTMASRSPSRENPQRLRRAVVRADCSAPTVPLRTKREPLLEQHGFQCRTLPG